MPATAHCADSIRRQQHDHTGIDMGKGDKKTRKGKTYRGSHGNVRPHSPTAKSAVKNTAAKVAPRAPAKKAPVRKAAAKKAAPKKTG
jgi:30S ribosomal protein S31